MAATQINELNLHQSDINKIECITKSKTQKFDEKTETNRQYELYKSQKRSTLYKQRL